jgi:hypothetical protein
MPTAVAKKKPSTKRSTASKNRKPTKAEVEAERQIEHIEFVKEWTGRNQQKWIKAHPSANLGDLLKYLEGVREELEAFNYDDVLAEIINQLGDAADWLGEWGPIEVHVDGDGEPATVVYRIEELQEDIDAVVDLAEAFGKLFKVKQLPKPKRRAKAA